MRKVPTSTYKRPWRDTNAIYSMRLPRNVGGAWRFTPPLSALRYARRTTHSFIHSSRRRP
eukprot:3905292-Prymnesium_polylepis.1